MARFVPQARHGSVWAMISFAVPVPEKTLLAYIRRMALQRGARGGNRALLIGIGDDCAVVRLRPKHEMLVTTDFSLEGVHFRRNWHPPESVGHRCLARGLSDIAAMGGLPTAAFLSLALPAELPQRWVERFARGLLTLARNYGVPLAGGDTAESPHGILADIVVIGTVPRGEAVRRAGARPGDRIYVSGELGGSAAALARMTEKGKGKLNPRDYPGHFFPQPRIELGRALREEGLVSAMIDLSDGLSTDLAHICEESGVGAEVEAQAVPRASVGKAAHRVDLPVALHGGEDYELLFTAPVGKRIPPRIAGIPITPIGNVVRRRKILLMSPGGIRCELGPEGWEHFKK
jgi:thiamine-monophosphate kinase